MHHIHVRVLANALPTWQVGALLALLGQRPTRASNKARCTASQFVVARSLSTLKCAESGFQQAGCAFGRGGFMQVEEGPPEAAGGISELRPNFLVASEISSGQCHTSPPVLFCLVRASPLPEDPCKVSNGVKTGSSPWGPAELHICCRRRRRRRSLPSPLNWHRTGALAS